MALPGFNYVDVMNMVRSGGAYATWHTIYIGAADVDLESLGVGDPPNGCLATVTLRRQYALNVCLLNC